ncbi:winged helix-turn-helix transcriptional regulator [uncultured Zoogloea sp.]|jgi:Lrp/AsnC family leucine-responsive transcriptional regulator|uniref:AsnC family transcriptional regulator n=1 Tax=Zoogloea oryzae TaxID=310767 RepID=A0ABQ6FFC2_9RHOO|nr:winged helix-turn-helix transcriptional regulator [uncultured Zoogloea sp.]MCK6376088.1 AsnC family transcriptional regulator [Zoogloea sp.]GLT23999.1 AsnC family transcriptional regulator [Zoogloea oryzae]
MRPLDPIDRKILHALQQDGRVTMTDLAAQVGLSATPCTERVRRLEREGIISGYHARVNPLALGLRVLVFIEIRVSNKSPKVLDEIRQSLEKLDEITECHLVTGDFDYLIKARLGALEDYHDLLCTLHSYLPGVVMQRSYVVMEELKETHYLRA